MQLVKRLLNLITRSTPPSTADYLAFHASHSPDSVALIENATCLRLSMLTVVLPSSMSCNDMVAPSGEGAMRCMKLALETVKAPIDYINPHATSTPIGDIKEIEAIRAVFGDKCPPISATKSLSGHSLGAAGAQEAIYSLLMMNNGFICESANIENIDPAMADMPIVRQRVDNAKLGVVLSNSFGFGGTNASLVMKAI